MEVSVVSREMIKPSRVDQCCRHEPHKVSLLDQLFPFTYVKCIFLYPNCPNSKTQTLNCLKKSLSETLNLYYPFSGRLKDNIYVTDFDSGVPFLEARVECRMSEYFVELDSLDELAPFRPLCMESGLTPEVESLPLLAFQANMFSCGGLALGISLCHKFADGGSLFCFLTSWAAFCGGDSSQVKVINPDLSRAAHLFPPMKELPEKYLSQAKRRCFNKRNCVTRRFIFDTRAVEALRDKARSDQVPAPTRHEAVSCFLWKHATLASWAASGRRGSSAVDLAIDMRRNLGRWSAVIGNFFWSATTTATSLELSELVKCFKGAIEDAEFRKMDGREGSGSRILLNELDSTLAVEGGDSEPEIFGFSNWKGFFNDVDFGWGKPVWVGSVGSVSHVFRNFGIFVDSPLGDKGIEATVTLDDKTMALLQSDLNFLAYTSPNSLNSRL